MKNPKILFGSVCACLISSGQVPEVRPQVAGRPVREGQVTVVYLAPRFTTAAIRMPDSVNSVVLGDPDSFTAEHSEREPQIVFVKPITAKASQTNLLGYQASLLLISRGESAGTQPNVDFLMRYRPPGRFVIEPSAPSVAIAQKVVLQTSNHAANRRATRPAPFAQASNALPSTLAKLIFRWTLDLMPAFGRLPRMPTQHWAWRPCWSDSGGLRFPLSTARSRGPHLRVNRF